MHLRQADGPRRHLRAGDGLFFEVDHAPDDGSTGTQPHEHVVRAARRLHRVRGEEARSRCPERVDSRGDAREREGAVAAALRANFVEKAQPLGEIEDSFQIPISASEQRRLDGLRIDSCARNGFSRRVDDFPRDLLAFRELDILMLRRPGDYR
jgi:hypothetical protein